MKKTVWRSLCALALLPTLLTSCMAFDETDPGYDPTTDPDYNPNGGTGGQTGDGGPAGGRGDGGKPSGGGQTGGNNSPSIIVAPSVLTSTAENVVLHFKNIGKL